MPNIESVPQVFYDPLHPYHHEFDNLPLRNIIFRQQIINSALNLQIQNNTEASGTAGSITNRLSQSLEDNGALKTTAIDNALHNIAKHNDGSTLISGIPTNFVRMLESERDKLTLIASEATDLVIRFETIGPSETPVDFDSGILSFEDSSTITWRLDSGKVKADMVFPTSAAHQHIYDQLPVHKTPLSPDFKNYETTSTATVFIEGSLRVYINGSRVSEDELLYVPGASPTEDWTLIKVTPSHATGEFALSTAITASDVIRIDFDVALT